MRSNDVYIAVNIWWRHGVEVDVGHCHARPGRSIKDLTFIEFGALHEAHAGEVDQVRLYSEFLDYGRALS